MSKYYTTIGLEIHAELNTNSKMFCGCANNPEEEKPNQNICPVCMAHPGTLPVMNKKAVESVIRVGLALGGTIADFSEFDRKNYFYPDIPKAYQISQYKYPIVSGGRLAGVDITRVHLEEDTATSKHDKGDYSLVDFNRAGVPLMELVTEPVIHSSTDAGDFAREAQLLFRYLGISGASMEKGEMRIELNISISPEEGKLGTKCEVKNIGSFRAVERAAEYEIKRMSKLFDEGRGDEIVQETRGWDDAKQETYGQRSKENANDYRYFPDPDLPKLFISKEFDIEKMRAELPELPAARRARYAAEYGIKSEDIESYVNDMNLGTYFESVALEIKSKEGIYLASNFITSDLVGLLKANIEAILPDYKAFSELIRMFAGAELSSRATKDILLILSTNGGDPRKIAEEKGLIQKNDEGALKEMAQKVIDANPAVVATYKGGKENAMMSLVGQIMKESKGSANPALVQKILKELLK
jgi:aspartyl-tRNA(Asn)/glutamyl-tRNA(Gln) amidotransferase subunit B